jgi:hypothetical protein
MLRVSQSALPSTSSYVYLDGRGIGSAFCGEERMTTLYVNIPERCLCPINFRIFKGINIGFSPTILYFMHSYVMHWSYCLRADGGVFLYPVT